MNHVSIKVNVLRFSGRHQRFLLDLLRAPLSVELPMRALGEPGSLAGAACRLANYKPGRERDWNRG